MNPIGASFDGDTYVVEACLRGGPGRGQYRGRRPRRADLGAVLVTVSAPQKAPVREVEARLRIAAEPVAALRWLGEVRGCAVMIEDEPAGRPLTAEVPGVAPLRQAVDLGIDLARAIDAAHRAGAVLQGLRPELIYVLRARDRLAITGIAPRCEPFLAGARPVTGSVPTVFEDVYLAPELIAMQPAAASADVFSACAVIARLLIGEYPFEGDGPWSRAESVLASRRRRLTGPLQLVGLLAHGMALRPEDRMTAAELAIDLGKLG